MRRIDPRIKWKEKGIAIGGAFIKDQLLQTNRIQTSFER